MTMHRWGPQNLFLNCTKKYLKSSSPQAEKTYWATHPPLLDRDNFCTINNLISFNSSNNSSSSCSSSSSGGGDGCSSSGGSSSSSSSGVRLWVR